MKTSLNFKPLQWRVNIDGEALAVETEKKKRNRLNRRSELYRGKYRYVQPKINLLRSYACETNCRRGASHDGETVYRKNYDMLNLCIFVV
ncbi:hypothetical protein TNCV_2911911 [Trichonephila clavipes]|nr:hypothetical protein TNCV_2911911 [Trichonephila clavipes]